MRKRFAALMCMVLLLSLCACSIGDLAYYHGKQQLAHGNYAKAYENFRASSASAAAEEPEKLVFVPLTYTYKSPSYRPGTVGEPRGQLYL